MRLLTLVAFTAIAGISARIVNKGGVINARDGNEAVMTCQFADVNADDLFVIWKRSGEIIATNEDANSDAYSVELTDSASILRIHRVEPIFSGDYSCQLGDDEEAVITFTVNVEVKPVVLISPAYIDTQIGQKNLVVVCHVKEGNPKPSVTWTKEGASWPTDIKLENENQKIVFSEVTKEHAGKYRCKAENIVGTHSDDLEITVSTSSNQEEKPWVKMDEKIITVNKNQDIDISCKYDGTPVPSVEWLFNGWKIASHRKFKDIKETAQRFDGYSMSTLRISKINEDTFGDYSCRVSSKLGTAQAVVHVNGKPGPPELSFEVNELAWTVRSLDKVLEYEFCYRFSGTDSFLPENCPKNRVGKNDNNGQDDKWTHSIDLSSYLEFDAIYEIQARARNSLGWGSFSREPIRVQLAGSSKKAPVKSAHIASGFFMTVFTILTIICLF